MTQAASDSTSVSLASRGAADDGEPMGLTRKVMSVGTLGAVDFRSDKERIARYTRTTADELKTQTKLARKDARKRAKATARQTRIMTAQAGYAARAATTPTAPAGWLADPLARWELRWWDGARWTEHVSTAGRGGVDPI